MSGKRKPRNIGPARTSAPSPAVASSTVAVAEPEASVAIGAVSSDKSGPTLDLALAEQARAAAATALSREAAAVRDEQGRAYTGIAVSVASLRLSPLRAAVVAALAGGATRLVAAAVVTDAPVVADIDLTILRELGGPVVPVQVLPLAKSR